MLHKKNSIQFISNSFKYIISLFFIVYVAKNINFSQLKTAVLQIDSLDICTVCCIYSLQIFLLNLRWYYVNKSLNIHLPHKTCLSITWISAFFAVFLPGGSLTGDAIRMWKLKKYSSCHISNFFSIFLDKIYALATLFILLIFGFYLDAQTIVNFFHTLDISIQSLLKFITYFICTIIIAILAAKNFLLKSLPYTVFKNLYQNTLQITAKNHLKISLLSILTHLGSYICYAILLTTFTSTLDFKCLFIFVPVLIVVGILPISICGMGIREYTMIYLFKLIGLSQEQSLSVGLILLAIYFTISGSGYLIYNIYTSNTKKLLKLRACMHKDKKLTTIT